jgi:hypothetical protein
MSSYPVILFTGYAELNNRSQGYISSKTMIGGLVAKSDPVTVEYEARAKNLLKAELKRKGVTYAQLAEKLREIGATENERNLNNKISRGGFSAAFLLQCLAAIGVTDVRV